MQFAEPSIREVEALIRKENSPEIVENTKIQPGMGADKETRVLLETFFKCCICHCVIIDPVECFICDNNYCMKCLKIWFKSS